MLFPAASAAERAAPRPALDPALDNPDQRAALLRPFDALAARIKAEAEGRRVVYIPNPGNFGDGLIRFATKRFLADHGIRHIEVNVGFRGGRYTLTPLLLQRGRHLFLYGGGGAWSDAYGFGHAICRYISRFTDSLIVLPSTYGFVPHRGIRGTLYRRDEFQSRERRPDAPFCHDMALYLYAIGERYGFAPRADERVGYLFRRDRESAGQDLPPQNIDVSEAGNHMSNGCDFLRTVAGYGRIHTDRLHVSIAGAILGGKVRLYRGNYFKIEAIYRSSMTGIPNISLVD